MSAYVIFTSRVTDPDGMAAYVPKAIETFAPFAPEILVVEDQVQVLEGTSDYSRMVVLKFKSRADAEAWYNSPEYREVRSLRLAASDGVGFIVDEWKPPTES